MTEPPLPAAGWYADPAGGPGQRYWDGKQWTEPPRPTRPSGGVRRGRAFGGAGGVLLVVGVVGVIGYNHQQDSKPFGKNAPTDAVVRITDPEGLCWTADIGDATQDGCQGTDVNVHDKYGLFVSTISKADSKPGTLTITLLINDVEIETNSTSAAYGFATVSNKG